MGEQNDIKLALLLNCPKLKCKARLILISKLCIKHNDRISVHFLCLFDYELQLTSLIRYSSLNHFNVMNYLGGGTFGKVYKAVHIESQETCVIKEILLSDLQHSGAGDKHIQQCLDEAKFLMRNRHPYIIGTLCKAWPIYVIYESISVLEAPAQANRTPKART